MRVIGRGSAGVRLFDVSKDEHVVSAALIEESDEEDVDGIEGEALEAAPTAETPSE